MVGRAVRPARFLAAITAAGESTRMGRPKPLLRWGEGTLLEAMIRTLTTAGFSDPCGILVGADREEVLEEVRRLKAIPLENPDFRAGRFTSIRLAAAWALGRMNAHDAMVALLLWPVDCPGIRAGTVRQLVAASISDPDSNIVPTFEGRAGHPVVLCRRFLVEIAGAGDDANLRDLMRDGPVERRLSPVDDPAVLDNLNTPGDYEEFLRVRSIGREVEAEDG